MPKPPATPATLRLHRRFRSPSLRTSRDVVVWLPPGYEATRRRHPVVYFQDGQNIFDPLTAFLGNAWHAGARAAELIAAGEITAPIMVGIYNRGFDRMSEYAPTPAEFSGWDGEKCRSKGHAKRYVKFVARELKPFIDARYRTLRGPKHTAVVGSSMGGLVALYFALWQPRVFGHVAALSPSLWWDDRVVIRDFARLRKKPPVRLWLDMGTAEPGWETVRAMRDGLVKRGWKPGRDLHYREVAGAEHTEHAWGGRIGDVITWLFGRAG
jgi:predicted alpha/beta superfamily hydrolase